MDLARKSAGTSLLSIRLLLASEAGRPRAVGLEGVVTDALGTHLHPLLESPQPLCTPGPRWGGSQQVSSAACPTAPPSGKSEYEAKEVPGPSLPASFPPPAGSFPPH